MFDRDSLYEVIDSHFVNHLVRDGEPATPSEAGPATAGDGTPAGEQGAAAADAPDNMLEDLLDELDDALEELHDEFGYTPKELTAAAIGFIDGVLAQADGSYSSLEDAYVEDMGNAVYAAADAVIADFAEQFEGNRDWGEAAMGYLRRATKPDGDAPAEAQAVIWQAQAQGFVYGADLCEDYEWKVIQTANGGILVTDEDAIQEFSMRQLEESGSGGLFGRVFDALGIDLSELEEALGTPDDAEDGAEDAKAETEGA